MSHFVSIINGMTNCTDKNLSNLAVNFISTGGGVVSANDYLVQAQSSPDKTVKINPGYAYVPTADLTMVYSTHLDATTNVTVANNTSGSAQIDAIVLYCNLSASVDANADNVATLADVRGSVNNTAPTNADILAAIGASNPYIILAQIAVANGFTSVNSGNITDKRAFAKLSGGDTVFQATLNNFVQSGCTIPTSGSLTSISVAGTVYVSGIKTPVPSDGGHLYTASNDAYVDATSSGALNYQSVANGAAAPALTASSVRIAKVVTSGSAVTSVVQTGLDSNGVEVYPTTPAVLRDNGTMYRQVAAGIYDNGNSGASITIDWSKGDRQKVTISANTTLSYSNQKAGQVVTLFVAENGSGNFTIALPTSKWPNGSAGSFTTTASAINILVVDYDGVNNLSQLAAGFA